jgi:hypothetical protein
VWHERADDECGDVAQLGERVNGIHEVVGSNPIVSTISFEFFLLIRVVPRELASRPWR